MFVYHIQHKIYKKKRKKEVATGYLNHQKTLLLLDVAFFQTPPIALVSQEKRKLKFGLIS